MQIYWPLPKMLPMSKRAYLQQMGIDVWQPRSALTAEIPLPKQPTEAWQQLAQEAQQCVACDLSQTRTHIVFGAGNQQADVLVVGEAPGASEDEQGEPFVGRAGLLLNNMLATIGLQRDDIYIVNILKCHPQNNRDPKPAEIALCTHFLERQITLLQPKTILAVGSLAAHFLLGSTESLGEMRGKSYQYQNIPLLVTYHPAYLLRSPGEKAKAMQDLCQLKNYLPSS